jgi:putative membrane protein
MYRCVIAFLALSLCGCRSQDRNSEHTSEQQQQAQMSRQKESPEPSTSKNTDPKVMATSVTLAADDKTFAQEAIAGGRFEVESSRIALDKSSSGKIRDFANMMIADHGQANQELENLARTKGLSIPTALAADMQAKLDELRQLGGDAFDTRYREMQIDAHDEAIRLFRKASNDAQDKDLRAFASKTLPTLQKHRDRLDEIQDNSSSSGG